jgi:hypothetical protein
MSGYVRAAQMSHVGATGTLLGSAEVFAVAVLLVVVMLFHGAADVHGS